MTPTRVLPFLLHTQGENVHVGIRTGITVTEIALQGLMRLEGDALIFQFRHGAPVRAGRRRRSAHAPRV